MKAVVLDLGLNRWARWLWKEQNLISVFLVIQFNPIPRQN